MLTLSPEGGPIPEPPKLSTGHWLAIGLELAIVTTFIFKGSVVGCILCLVYGMMFSATRAGLIYLKGD